MPPDDGGFSGDRVFKPKDPESEIRCYITNSVHSRVILIAKHPGITRVPKFLENGEGHRGPNVDVEADRGGGVLDEADVGRRLKSEEIPHVDSSRAMKCQV